MLGQFLLAFREGLEAALIIAIIVAYLKRTGKGSLSRDVWRGLYLAVIASFTGGGLIWLVYGGLSGAAKYLFEGVAALFAVFVLSFMIYWMATKGKELRIEVEKRVEAIVTRGASLAMVSFSFIVVFREGIETVLFLTPFLVNDVLGTLIGASLGIVASIIIAYVVFAAGMNINLRKFFYFISILLVLLAGGLAGYGTHELVEYSEEVEVDLGWLSEPAYTLDIPTGHLLHHKGIIGSVFAVMFGYTVKAEWIRVIAHFAYLAIALPVVIWIYQKRPAKKNTLH